MRSLGMAINESAYGASKGGILAMDTPMNAPVMKDAKALAYWSNQIPIGRAGTANERASAILWLPSDEAS